MKLLFIYGPPAAGKLTIGEKVSELSGVPLFHNHLSRDLVKDIYGDKLEDNYDLVDQIRFDVLEHCSKNGTDLIFTYVYEGPDDDDKVKTYVSIVENNGGEVVFVELTASRDELIDRVDNESRKRFKKLSDPERMREITKDMSVFSIPFVNPLIVNTSQLSQDESAQVIVQKFKLRRAS